MATVVFTKSNKKSNALSLNCDTKGASISYNDVEVPWTA